MHRRLIRRICPELKPFFGMWRRSSTSSVQDGISLEENDENADSEPFFYPSTSWLDMQSIGGANWKASLEAKEDEKSGGEEGNKEMVQPKVIQTLANHINLHAQLEKVAAQGASDPDPKGGATESHQSHPDNVSNPQADDISKAMRLRRLEHLFRLFSAEQPNQTVGDLVDWTQKFHPVNSELRETDIRALTEGQSRADLVNKEAFMSLMLKVLDPYDDWELFEMGWLTIMCQLMKKVFHQDMLKEINPPEYSEIIATFPTHQITPYISCSELKQLMTDDGERLIIIDVRTEEEREISSIKGSRHSKIVLDKSVEKGYRLTRSLQEILRGDDPTLEDDELYDRYQDCTIVTVCNTGLRSAAAAIEFMEDMDRLVRCLCGGLIHYFNSGGEMVDSTGEAVEKLHPGSEELKKFVIRENKILE